MYKLLLSLLIWVGVNFSLFAQKIDTPTSSLLWKIEHEQMEKPAYMFGSIHVICANEMFWSPTLDSIILDADEVLFEVNMPKFFSQYIDDRFNDIVSFRDSIVLHAFDSTDTTDKCYYSLSYEQAFSMMAYKHQKTFGHLETMMGQVLALYRYAAFNDKNDTTNNKNSYKQLVTLYQSQDVNAIEKYTESITSYHQMDELFYKRNKRWAKKLNNYLKKSTHTKLIVFGAGHLGGEYGMINLLRSTGFQVTPVFLQTN